VEGFRLLLFPLSTSSDSRSVNRLKQICCADVNKFDARPVEPPERKKPAEAGLQRVGVAQL